MAEKIYLDDQGNPVASTVYLDEQGNPVASGGGEDILLHNLKSLGGGIVSGLNPLNAVRGAGALLSAVAHPVETAGRLYSAAKNFDPKVLTDPQANIDVPNIVGQALGAGVLGSGASGVLGAAGRGLYRTAVRPAAALTTKYGDLIGRGLEEGAPVGASAEVQAKMLASKNALTQAAEQSGGHVRTATVTGKYEPLLDVAANREALGMPGDFQEIASRERAFTAAHPTGQIPAAQALAMKREADSLSQTAQNQLRRGVTPTDMTARLHNATREGLNEGLSAIIPDYAAQNQNTSQLYGLSKALKTAENRPHALTNLASVGEGVVTGKATKGLLMRFLLDPRLQSRAGILAHRGGQLPIANLLRAALMGQMADEAPATSPITP